MCRNCLDPLSKFSYTPLEASIRWCGLMAFESELLQASWVCPEQLSALSPSFYCLGNHLSLLLDALQRNELPSHASGLVLSVEGRVEFRDHQIRHTDLIHWMTRYHPDQKPPFLFPCDTSELAQVKVGVHYAVKSENEAMSKEICKMASLILGLREQVEKLEDQLKSSTPPNGKPLASGEYVIGALLRLLLTEKSAKKDRPLFSSQDAVSDAILYLQSDAPPVSKRTINQWFADANKRWDKSA